MSMLGRMALVGVVLAAACSDPQDPCDRPDACEFPGVHLDLEVALAPADLDPEDGMPEFAPADLAIVVTVVNRGDTVSEPVYLDAAAAYFGVDTIVPKLRAGGRWRAELDLSQRYPFRILSGSDTLRARVGIAADAEMTELVDQAWTPPFHLLVPAVRVEVEPVHDSIVLGHDAPLFLKVTNVSRQVPLPTGVLSLRLVQEWDFFFPAWEPMSFEELEPGAVLEDVFLVTVPPDAGWLAGALEYRVYACFEPSGQHGVDDPYLAGGCGWSSAEVPGIPDLSRCTEATAIPGELATTRVTCAGWRDWAYWALDVQEGTRYVADRNVTFYSRSGGRLHTPATVTEWAAPFTGRVYAVVAFPGPQPALRMDIGR